MHDGARRSYGLGYYIGRPVESDPACPVPVDLRSTSGRHHNNHGPCEVDRLTPRELQVARMVAQGMSNQQIADTLVCSRSVVYNHVHAAFDKLGFLAEDKGHHRRVLLTLWIQDHDKEVM